MQFTICELHWYVLVCICIYLCIPIQIFPCCNCIGSLWDRFYEVLIYCSWLLWIIAVLSFSLLSQLLLISGNPLLCHGIKLALNRFPPSEDFIHMGITRLWKMEWSTREFQIEVTIPFKNSILSHRNISQKFFCFSNDCLCVNIFKQ